MFGKPKPRTLITIRVKSPTVLNQKKMQDIQTILTNRIVDPFHCDLEVRYSYDTPEPGILSFYIFRRGKLKRSVARKLIDTLDMLDRFWPDMIEYVVDNVVLEGNNVD